MIQSSKETNKIISKKTTTHNPGPSCLRVTLFHKSNGDKPSCERDHIKISNYNREEWYGPGLNAGRPFETTLSDQTQAVGWELFKQFTLFRPI